MHSKIVNYFYNIYLIINKKRNNAKFAAAEQRLTRRYNIA